MFVGLRPKTYILLALSTTVLAVFPHIKLLSPPHTAEMEAELCCHRRANYLTWGSFIQGVYVLHSLSLSLVSWCTVNELRALAQYMAGPFRAETPFELSILLELKVAPTRQYTNNGSSGRCPEQHGMTTLMSLLHQNANLDNETAPPLLTRTASRGCVYTYSRQSFTSVCAATVPTKGNESSSLQISVQGRYVCGTSKTVVPRSWDVRAASGILGPN